MTTHQKQVMHMLAEYGPLPDHVLVPLAQHLADVPMSSSSIRSRRAELAKLGRVEQVGQIEMPSGRGAAVWAVKQ